MTQNTPEELNALQQEYRRKQRRIWKSTAVFLLLSVAFSVVAGQTATSWPNLTRVIFLSILLGLAGLVFYVFRTSRCPNCGFPLWLGGKGTLGGKCLGCGVQLYVPWRSKGGKWTAQ
jgi:hypothetical protein